MTPIKKKVVYTKPRGAVLIISMIFVLICSTLAVSMVTLSSTNVQLASNQHKVNCAFASAESGLEVMRYWLTSVTIPSSTPSYHYFSTIAYTLHNDLADNYISNISLSYDGSTITLPSVTLASADDMSFEAVIRQLDDDTVQMDVTGRNDQITRTIRVYYDIEAYEYPIFDFGLATKGPLLFNGNPNVRGVNSNSEADIFIESQNDNLALRVTGNTDFDGDITIANADADAFFEGDVLIGGDQGQEAIDNHVSIGGEDAPEFPLPDTEHFLQYATGDTIDSSTDVSGGMTLTNATIEAGTNPTFGGNITIEGILLVESPNIVTFTKNVALNGMIVGDGDAYNPGTNNISFLGNFATNPVPSGAEFDAIRSETGSSILAPGFAASFQGNFSALGGIMAVSGAEFSGNVNALIEGTIISYSDNPIIIEGNATLNFDQSADIGVPAGFDLLRVLTYDPDSYSEVPQ
ncbi:MAG: pilus assembly PilX family protein [Planctomycetota bacterium]|jgi:hypothetical protein